MIYGPLRIQDLTYIKWAMDFLHASKLCVTEKTDFRRCNFPNEMLCKYEKEFKTDPHRVKIDWHKSKYPNIIFE